MSLDEEKASCKGRRYFLDTCIDGNACKENAANERWVGIRRVRTDVLSGSHLPKFGRESPEFNCFEFVFDVLTFVFYAQVLREAPDPSLSGKQNT